MPESIPLRSAPNHRPGTLLFDSDLAHPHDHPQPASRAHSAASRQSSPHADASQSRGKIEGKKLRFEEPSSPSSDLSFDDWDESAPSMPSDLRPDVDREREGRSQSPLLGSRKSFDEGVENGGLLSRSTHTFHERDPESQAHFETKRKYTYAAIFLALSLVSFTVQTETAVYIQHELKWEKPYCML